MKNNNGITLIALIITIVVLLILAAITLTTISSNNSALSKAHEAKVKTEGAEITDALQLNMVNLKTKYWVSTTAITKNDLYENKASFVESTKWDENEYSIETYQFNQNAGLVVLEIKKANGTGIKHRFNILTEIDAVLYVDNDDI